jgi:hypothetical protein
MKAASTKWSLLVGIALLACLVGGALFLLERGSDGGHVSPRKLSARATMSTRTVLFGDTVEARLNLILPHRLAGTTFHGNPNFRPFRVVSTHVDRADLGGGLEQISLTYGLTCVSKHCVSTGASIPMQFAPTIIRLPGIKPIRALWPSFVEVSRAENVKAPLTTGLDSVPAVFPGLQPRTDAEEALIVAAVSLVALVAAWFIVRIRVRRREEAAARAATLLQTLLARVETGIPEEVIYQQRHALDALAVELRHRHINGTLALRAERLAWAPEHPDPAQIRQLVTEIRQVAER